MMPFVWINAASAVLCFVAGITLSVHGFPLMDSLIMFGFSFLHVVASFSNCLSVCRQREIEQKLSEIEQSRSKDERTSGD